MSVKISPIGIIKSHISTLRNDESGRVSFTDWFVFYACPFVGFAASTLFGGRVTNEVLNGSASVFGIFVGLLLNVQVAMFGIFMRKPEKSDDLATQEVYNIRIRRRSIVLREINANISYLILLCSAGIALCVLFISIKANGSLYAGIVMALYIHVLLNLAMTIKRAFILFDAEYQNP